MYVCSGDRMYCTVCVWFVQAMRLFCVYFHLFRQSYSTVNCIWSADVSKSVLATILYYIFFLYQLWYYTACMLACTGNDAVLIYLFCSYYDLYCMCFRPGGGDIVQYVCITTVVCTGNKKVMCVLVNKFSGNA